MLKNNKLMGTAKDTIKVGATVMVGQGLLGGLANAPGMPAQASQTANVASSGLGLIAVGQLAKTGLTLAGEMAPVKKTKPKTDAQKRINKILG